jgi:hypothetical protein
VHADVPDKSESNYRKQSTIRMPYVLFLRYVLYYHHKVQCTSYRSRKITCPRFLYKLDCELVKFYISVWMKVKIQIYMDTILSDIAFNIHKQCFTILCKYIVLTDVWYHFIFMWHVLAKKRANVLPENTIVRTEQLVVKFQKTMTRESLRLDWRLLNNAKCVD